jgi:hypothetical protein
LPGLLIEWLQRQEGRRGQTAEAMSGASASAATNDDTGAKRGKKDETGKKE